MTTGSEAEPAKDLKALCALQVPGCHERLTCVDSPPLLPLWVGSCVSGYRFDVTASLLVTNNPLRSQWLWFPVRPPASQTASFWAVFIQNHVGKEA